MKWEDQHMCSKSHPYPWMVTLKRGILVILPVLLFSRNIGSVRQKIINFYYLQKNVFRIKVSEKTFYQILKKEARDPTCNCVRCRAHGKGCTRQTMLTCRFFISIFQLHHTSRASIRKISQHRSNGARNFYIARIQAPKHPPESSNLPGSSISARGGAQRAQRTGWHGSLRTGSNMRQQTKSLLDSARMQRYAVCKGGYVRYFSKCIAKCGPIYRQVPRT